MLSNIICIDRPLEKCILMVGMNKRNGYSILYVFYCLYGNLIVISRQVVNLCLELLCIIPDLLRLVNSDLNWQVKVLQLASSHIILTLHTMTVKLLM